MIITGKNNPSKVLKHEASSLNERRKTIMEQIKKDPNQIVQHFISNHNNVCFDGQSELVNRVADRLVPGSKTFYKCETTSASLNCVENPDEHLVNEIFLEHFWDVISPEEFADCMKSMFERS